MKRKAFDSNYVRGKSRFEKDGIQNYLLFQTASRYFKTVTHTSIIRLQK